jgi:hypothetical protein
MVYNISTIMKLFTIIYNRCVTYSMIHDISWGFPGKLTPVL